MPDKIDAKIVIINEFEKYSIVKFIIFVTHQYSKMQGRNIKIWHYNSPCETILIGDCDGRLCAIEIKWGKKNPKLPNVFANAYQNAEYYVINKENYLDWV